MSKITIIKVPKGGLVDSVLSGQMFEFFTGYMGYIWLIVAILFLFAELNTPGLFFFVSFAIGAFAAAVAAFAGYAVIAQCLIALAVSLVSFGVMRTYLKSKRLSDVRYEHPNTNIDALLSKKGVVTKVIEPHKKGVVRVGGETWRARCEGEEILKTGAVVSIVRIEGNTIIVKPEGT